VNGPIFLRARRGHHIETSTALKDLEWNDRYYRADMTYFHSICDDVFVFGKNEDIYQWRLEN
jgi:hypothetical protein